MVRRTAFTLIELLVVVGCRKPAPWDEAKGFVLATTRRKSFTLIELLVVVAIIAVLIAILLPALSRARELGRITQCLSQEKQQFLSCSYYMDESAGWLPGYLVYGWVTDDPPKWYLNLMRYLAGYSDSPGNYFNVPGGFIGSSYVGHGKGSILDCPSSGEGSSVYENTGQPYLPGPKDHNNWDYNYDYTPSPSGAPLLAGCKPYEAMSGSGCPPAEQMMAMDTSRGDYPWGYIRWMHYAQVLDVVLPHLGGNVILYWDGHAGHLPIGLVPKEPGSTFWNE